jgi:hypothetical protein
LGTEKKSTAAVWSEAMSDEQLAAMHRLLAEHHRKIAKKAMLDLVQQYHVDLAQRLMDEAVQIPRRTRILERLHESEQRRIGAMPPSR